MDAFWKIVGILTQINDIHAENLRDAVKIAFNDYKYGFYQNAELIDVKDRFRIFRFQNKNYIAKKMSLKKAELELCNSRQAAEILFEQKINGRKIVVIVPQKVVVDSSDNHCFLVSEYLGHTLHENTYNGTQSVFTLYDCFEMLRLFLQKGIIYRGFLQRNMICRQDTVFLFDWEDAFFSDKPAFEEFHNLWQTNFVLNWSYIYNYNDVIKNLIPFIKDNIAAEPPLVKYEQIFKKMTNFDGNDMQLRDAIKQIVFKAELPLTISDEYFYIRPHDMGHLIADTFPGEVDVFYDILAASIRMRDEKRFYQWLRLVTKFYVLFYKDKFSMESRCFQPMQYYIFIPLIMGLDDFSDTVNWEQMMELNSMPQLLAAIEKLNSYHSFVRKYLNQEFFKCTAEFESAMKEKFVCVCPWAEERQIQNIDNISEYVLLLSNGINRQVAA